MKGCIEMRIAVCNDQPECLEQSLPAVKKCLKGVDARVDLFPNVTVFLREFKNRPYDLVFVDI